MVHVFILMNSNLPEVIKCTVEAGCTFPNVVVHCVNTCPTATQIHAVGMVVAVH